MKISEFFKPRKREKKKASESFSFSRQILGKSCDLFSRKTKKIKILDPFFSGIPNE